MSSHISSNKRNNTSSLWISAAKSIKSKPKANAKMWLPTKSNEGKNTTKNSLVAVAIDRDKSSQYALKWAVENMLTRGQTVILIHVLKHSSQSSWNPFGYMTDANSNNAYAVAQRKQIERDTRDMFLAFHCFCTRKDIQCHDVTLNDNDVAKAVTEYASYAAIENLVLGASSRGFLKKFKSSDIPGTVSKSAPDFCSVYIISKGKMSSVRNAIRAAPFSSPLFCELQTDVVHKSAAKNYSKYNLSDERVSSNRYGESVRGRYNRHDNIPSDSSEPESDISFVSSGSGSSSFEQIPASLMEAMKASLVEAMRTGYAPRVNTPNSEEAAMKASLVEAMRTGYAPRINTPSNSEEVAMKAALVEAMRTGYAPRINTPSNSEEAAMKASLVEAMRIGYAPRINTPSNSEEAAMKASLIEAMRTGMAPRINTNLNSEEAAMKASLVEAMRTGYAPRINTTSNSEEAAMKASLIETMRTGMAPRINTSSNSEEAAMKASLMEAMRTGLAPRINTNSNSEEAAMKASLIEAMRTGMAPRINTSSNSEEAAMKASLIEAMRTGMAPRINTSSNSEEAAMKASLIEAMRTGMAPRINTSSNSEEAAMKASLIEAMRTGMAPRKSTNSNSEEAMKASLIEAMRTGMAPRISTNSNSEQNLGYSNLTDDSSVQNFSRTSIDSSGTSGSSEALEEAEAEMRRLKLELKQTMEMYSTACREAITAKQKAMELRRWRMEEERKLEEARLAEEAALAIAEKEKAKCRAAIEAAEAHQRIAELESQKRIMAEMKALKEADEMRKMMNSMGIHDLRCRKYCIEEIEAATDYFSASKKIGEGGYGSVYKCYLDNTPVAVKVLRPDAAQGRSQFQQEVDVLSCIRHPNMVLLLGACPEYGCLIYEYMANGSLDDRLFQRGKTPPLSWQQRFRISAEIATGLLFLHQTKPEPIVHRDLKPGNILLDHNFVSKISDVGLARLVPANVADNVTQYRMTSTAGTFCYIDPEYQQTGMLGVKSDVYSLGIMLLQIITSKVPMGLAHNVEQAIEEGTFADMLDPAVTDWPVEEATSFAKLALKCAELRRKDRPDLGQEVLPELNKLRIFAGESEQMSWSGCSIGKSGSNSQASVTGKGDTADP